MCIARPLTGRRHVTVLLLVIRNATVKSMAVVKTQPFLFIFMTTPYGTATTVVTITSDDSFFFRIHIRSPTSLWRYGSTLSESALNCGCQSCLPAIGHQWEHSTTNSTTQCYTVGPVMLIIWDPPLHISVGFWHSVGRFHCELWNY